MAALIDEFSKKELKKLVKESNSFHELISKLGYGTRSGSNHITVKKRLEQYNIDYSHFNNLNREMRTVESVFVENSTVTQKTLRDWYIKGNYSPYECSICKMQPMWQDKPLTLILDHKNGINTDNRLENLRWVCPNCNQQLPTTGFYGMKKYNLFGNKLAKDEPTKKPRKKCVDCGTIISRHAIRCNNCNNKFKKENNELPITRELLKSKIRTQSFTSIGKEFDVSDNAVKKWCKKYNLPCKTSIIKNITDEEWTKV